jgi:hypothetical protein
VSFNVVPDVAQESAMDEFEDEDASEEDEELDEAITSLTIDISKTSVCVL